MRPAIIAASRRVSLVGASSSCSAAAGAAAAAAATATSSMTTTVQTRHYQHSSSTIISTSTSTGGGKTKTTGRDHRVPLLVGGSLVGAGSLQYYLHQRALATGGSAAAQKAHTAAAAATTGLQRRGLSTSSSSSSSSSGSGSGSPPSASPSPPPPRVQAPSLWRRGVATAAAAKAEGEKNPLQGLEITLYQYKICPFCCKVKGVLDLYKVPYTTLDVNPLTKAEIKFSQDYRKVPIARLGPGPGPDQDEDAEIVRDSSAIVERIAALLRQAHAAPTAAELDAFFSPEAERWAAWADMELAVLLFPNITRNFAESYQAFAYVQDVPHFSFWDKLTNQWVGATAMWAAQGKIKKKYNITDERAALKGALDDWAAQVSGPEKDDNKAPFLGGKAPNYGDVAVYACLRAIEGLDAWKEIMAGNAAVAAWYARVELAIGASACVKAE